ncbi:MAG TPA: oxidase [Planctomycetes bacterium]|nr:oxidase [Fuerstiella sp.]HIK96082.1 oxidase [Planctomycetota bacterium]
MAHDDDSAHHVNYLAVFAVLCVFTGLSVAFDVAGFSNHLVTIVLVLAVAVCKALCVMMFFMHLKFEGNWKYVLLAPTTILAIGLPLALLPDIGVAYYTPLAPQAEWRQEMEDHASHSEHGGHTDNIEHAEKQENPGHSDEGDDAVDLPVESTETAPAASAEKAE